jgi:integrase
VAVQKRAKARRRRFTEVNVLQLAPKHGRQYLVWDAGTGAARGLAILVSPTGTASYRVCYRFPGSPRPHWKHLGRVGEMELEKAREQARHVRGMAAEGDDPRAGDAKPSDTFQAVLEAYTRYKQSSDKGAKSAAATERLIKSACADWLDKPIGSIRTSQVETLLERIRDGDGERKAAPYMSVRLYAQLGGLFRWAATKKKLKVSPMFGVEKPWHGAKPRTYSWFEGDGANAAVKRLWEIADKLGGDEGRYLKLAILTGKRHQQQIHPMRWEEISSDWVWTPRGNGSKHKRTHSVPLSSLAQRVLGPRQENGRVFTSVRSNLLEHIKALATGVPFLKQEPFLFQGCKHMMETGLAKLKVQPHIRDLLLDHASKRGIGSHYDHHPYMPEMREATEKWSKQVESIVQP